MKNKTLNTFMIRHGDKIATWYKDSDGYWIKLQYGWQATPFSEVHTLHEQNIAEVMKTFRNVAPCNCLFCRSQGKQWKDYDMDTGKMIIRSKHDR